jgi:hypothetical protein
VASGHLALDPGGCHPPDQGSTLIFWQAATIWVATVAAAAVERVSSPRPSPTIRESGRRPPGDNVGDSRRPLEESPDHLGKTWGNQLIAHSASWTRAWSGTCGNRQAPTLPGGHVQRDEQGNDSGRAVLRGPGT